MTPISSHLLLVTLLIGTARCTILPILFNVLGSEVKPRAGPLLETTNEMISKRFNANQATNILPQNEPPNNINVPGGISDWDLLKKQMPPRPRKDVKYVSSCRPVARETGNVPQAFYYVKPGVQRVPMPGRKYVIRIQNPSPLPVPASAPAPLSVPGKRVSADFATVSSPLTLSMDHTEVTR